MQLDADLRVVAGHLDAVVAADEAVHALHLAGCVGRVAREHVRRDDGVTLHRSQSRWLIGNSGTPG